MLRTQRLASLENPPLKAILRLVVSLYNREFREIRENREFREKSLNSLNSLNSLSSLNSLILIELKHF
jgi:hypothetical protein